MTTIDIDNALSPENKHLKPEGDDGQVHTRLEHNYEPELEQDTIPQLETETLTKSDP